MPTTPTPAIHSASAHAAAALPVTAMQLGNGRTREVAACFGVCCELHAECARYQAIEAAGPRIGTCATSDKRRPLFVGVAHG